MYRTLVVIVNFIGTIGVSLILAVLALRTMARSGRSGSKLNLAVAAMPLLLTIVIPVPFALTVRGPTDWARHIVVSVSQVGIMLSVVLFMIGAVLTLRAVRAGDREAAAVLALETALAGLPAGIVTAYALLFRFV